MLEEIKKAIEDATGIPFALFSWETAPVGDYGVVGLVGDIVTMCGDDAVQDYAVNGYIDIILSSAGDDVMVAVTEALKDFPNMWYDLDNVWYDKNIQRTHYMWHFAKLVTA